MRSIADSPRDALAKIISTNLLVGIVVLRGLVIVAHRSFPIPTSRVPEATWQELTDPMSFVVGSIIRTFYSPEAGADLRILTPDESNARIVRRAFRATGAVTVGIAVAFPVIIGTRVPKLDTGDPFAYALTLLVGGALTLVPGRIADIRVRAGVETADDAYPQTLRRIMWAIELALSIAALVAIVGVLGGAGQNEAWRAVAWGVLAVSLSEMATFSAVSNMVDADEGIHDPRVTALMLQIERRLHSR
jgi:hypothetical protein